jgi:hypothetical protein
MDAPRFDRLARSLTNASSRRGLLSGLAATAIGLAAMRFSGGVAAKKKRKNKNKKSKKLKLNVFRCVNVGGKCKGNSANCCSGICQGKKPKRGEKDKSRCVAHNVEECQPEQDACLEFPTPCGTGGVCFRTTGETSFCGAGGECRTCSKDTDCQAEFGAGAACVACADECAGTGGTACLAAVA